MTDAFLAIISLWRFATWKIKYQDLNTPRRFGIRSFALGPLTHTNTAEMLKNDAIIWIMLQWYTCVQGA